MWKCKVDAGGKWLWFTSTTADKEKAEDEIIEEALSFYSEWFGDPKEEIILVLDDLEWVE